jgi:hypothetical protein
MTSFNGYSRAQGSRVKSGGGKPGIGAQAVNSIGQGTDGVIATAERYKQDAPFLGQEGKQLAQTMGGATELTAGILGGNRRQISQGWDNLKNGVYSALTAQSLLGLNKPPPQQFLGGSQEALDQRRQMYMAGLQGGNEMMGLGAAGAGDGMGMAAADRGYGYDLAGAGIVGQAMAIDQARQMAARPTDSLARLQLQQGLAQNQQAMLAQAAQARGGNQAAAMRQAQMLGTQEALQTNAQAAQLRAAEQQAAINRQLGVEQMAAQASGQQLGLGMGAAQAGTAQYSQNALGVGQLGLGSQGQYLDAQAQADKAQLEADTKWASAKKAAQGGIMGTVGRAIGSFFGK